jgi:hypothetical protein
MEQSERPQGDSGQYSGEIISGTIGGANGRRVHMERPNPQMKVPDEVDATISALCVAIRSELQKGFVPNGVADSVNALARLLEASK